MGKEENMKFGNVKDHHLAQLQDIVLFILFYFYIVVDNIIYNFIMIGGHNKNVCLSWTKVIFKKNLFI